MIENRKATRFSISPTVSVRLIDSTQRPEPTPKRGVPVDISTSGAYIDIQHPPTDQDREYAVEFSMPENNHTAMSVLRRQCKVLPERSADSRGCAIKFMQPISFAELSKFVIAPKQCGSLDLARRDYDHVAKGIDSIQNCRSNWPALGKLIQSE